MPQTPYYQLINLAKRFHLMGSIQALLEWDQETYMPKKGAQTRAEACELLAGLYHHERTSPSFSKALSKVVDLESGEFKDLSLTEEQRASAREFRRDYLKQMKLPREFVEEFASVTATAHHAWAEARAKNQFLLFQPHLERIVELNRKKADYLGYEEHAYDALLDVYEPEMKTKTLTELFEKLKIPLMDLLKKIQTQQDPETPFFDLEYDHDRQLQCGREILTSMGLTEEFSRLDESIHPMCVPIHPTDMRMTTRIYPQQVAVNILSCLHEGGHGLYSSNLPIEHYGTPLCETASLGMDESQSRTWETLIGRSLPFWKYFFPVLQEHFSENLNAVSLDAFYKGLNLVEPSLIRVDSDEVGYNLHVMIRFEIEKSFIEKKLKVADLPDIWNEKMRTYLGITPKADSEGCLQDIHWSMGAIGYFPTYTLGNLYAAQFFDAFKQDHPNWESEVERGHLQVLAQWQKKEIHQHGRRYLPQNLCEKVTGFPLSEKPYLEYLTKKYTAIYQL